MEGHKDGLEKLVRETLARFQPQVSWALDELAVQVPPEHIQEACRTAKEDPRLDCDYLRCLSAVDYKTYFQVVYHLYSTAKRHKLVIKVNLPTDKPEVPTVTPVWKGANWHEREAAELFGITFLGHPNPTYLLLYPGFEGYPMLKSYPFYSPEGEPKRDEHRGKARHG